MELRVEDSGRGLLTLDGYPTSPGMCAQEQRCSPKTLKTPVIFNIDRMTFFLYIVSQPFKVTVIQLPLEKCAVFHEGEKLV
jgi:hypothetical protein